MICKLCLNKTELCDSHIIPDFMYKDFYNQYNKIEKMYVEQPERVIRSSSGEYEVNFLCKDCECLISKFETYAKIILTNFENDYSSDDGMSFSINEMRNIYNIENVDYKKMKLFFISLLWRMSISQRDLFKIITLPEDLNEEMRKMLLTEVPGEVFKFPTIVVYFKNEKRIKKKIISSPVTYEDNGFINIIIGYFLFSFLISSKYVFDLKADICLEDNGFKIIEYPPGILSPILSEMAGVNLFE
jgi:hypothetical protein